jgi:hypothetical protein
MLEELMVLESVADLSRVFDAVVGVSQACMNFLGTRIKKYFR